MWVYVGQFRWIQVLGVMFTFLIIFFSEGKFWYIKKQTVQDFIQSPRTYAHIFT